MNIPNNQPLTPLQYKDPLIELESVYENTINVSKHNKARRIKFLAKQRNKKRKRKSR